MSRNLAVATAVAAATLVALACSDRPKPTAPLTVAVYGQRAASSANANGGNFGTPLKPSEEVMPAGVVNTSNAVGNAVYGCPLIDII